jgi:hypothetical protein
MHPKMSAIAADYDPVAAEMMRAVFKAEAAEKAAAQAAQHDNEEEVAMCTVAKKPTKKKRKQWKAPIKSKKATEQDF